MNVYYMCNANKTWENPGGCRGLIRSDRWTQLLTIAEEDEREGAGQRWYCHCGARYMCAFGVCIEVIDHAASPPQAWYLQSPFPEQDIKDLKTMLRHSQLTKQGIVVTKPQDLLKYLPKVEPLAVGTVFAPYAEGNPTWERHYVLMEHLTWEDLPEFNWNELYMKAEEDLGLNNKEWEGYNQKTKNKYRRQRINAMKNVISEIESRRNLATGSLGGGGAGVAPDALPAGGGRASSSTSPGAPAPPPGEPSAAAQANAPPPPPPTYPPPNWGHPDWGAAAAQPGVGATMRLVEAASSLSRDALQAMGVALNEAIDADNNDRTATAMDVQEPGEAWPSFKDAQEQDQVEQISEHDRAELAWFALEGAPAPRGKWAEELAPSVALGLKAQPMSPPDAFQDAERAAEEEARAAAEGPRRHKMEVGAIADEGDAGVLYRPCVDCGMQTGRFCDYCRAADRMPGERWAAGQLTPLCSVCDDEQGSCHYCRGKDWATPPPKGNSLDLAQRPSAGSSASAGEPSQGAARAAGSQAAAPDWQQKALDKIALAPTELLVEAGIAPPGGFTVIDQEAVREAVAAGIAARAAECAAAEAATNEAFAGAKPL